MKFSTWTAIFALALLAGAVTAEGPDGIPGTDAPDSTPVVVGGLEVAIDPKTGRLRPLTDDEAARLAEQFRRRFVDLSVDQPVRYHADGSFSKELGTATMSYAFATLDDDGGLTTHCIAGAERAAEFLGAAGADEPASAETGQ